MLHLTKFKGGFLQALRRRKSHLREAASTENRGFTFMKCQSCEMENPDGANFCRGCGTKLEKQAAASTAASELAEEKEVVEAVETAPAADAMSAQPAEAAPEAKPEAAPAQTRQAQPQAQPQQTQTQVPPQQQTQQAQTQPQAQVPPQQAQAQAQAQPSVDVKGGISNLQGKLDNSSSSLLRGRSLWDVVGVCAAALMVLCFFLPAASSTSDQVTASFSLASLMSMAGSFSYTSSFSALFFIYLFPPILCLVDLLVTKENSTRHVRLIVFAVMNMLLQSSISSVAGAASSMSPLFGISSSSSLMSLGIGFYLSIFASIVMVVVGILGIYEKKKGRIAG